MEPLLVERHIAAGLCKLRPASSLILDAVITSAGTSSGLLSEIENAKLSFPISTYSRIAIARAGRDRR